MCAAAVAACVWQLQLSFWIQAVAQGSVWLAQCTQLSSCKTFWLLPGFFWIRSVAQEPLEGPGSAAKLAACLGSCNCNIWGRQWRKGPSWTAQVAHLGLAACFCSCYGVSQSRQ